jgi:hypothetical protein
MQGMPLALLLLLMVLLPTSIDPFPFDLLLSLSSLLEYIDKRTKEKPIQPQQADRMCYGQVLTEDSSIPFIVMTRLILL